SECRDWIGIYALHYEAYWRAAETISKEENRQVLPREMQSITWETVRGLYVLRGRHLALPRITSDRWDNGSASAYRPWSRYNSAKLFSEVATSGWSGPKAFSRITSDRWYNGSASKYRPWVWYSEARLFSD